MAIVEDYTAYFADFGVTATLGAASVRGIFDAAYQDALGIVGSSQPVFTAATADVAAAAVGSAITINAVAYTIAEIQPDGTGVTRLFLKS